MSVEEGVRIRRSLATQLRVQNFRYVKVQAEKKLRVNVIIFNFFKFNIINIDKINISAQF